MKAISTIIRRLSGQDTERETQIKSALHELEEAVERNRQNLDRLLLNQRESEKALRMAVHALVIAKKTGEKI